MHSFPHDRSSFFQTTRYWNAVERFFVNELENDGDDSSSALSVPISTRCTASVRAKENGILAGKEEIVSVFSSIFPNIQFQFFKDDGAVFENQDIVLTLGGNAREILKAERVVLNVLSRMSGIATQTKTIQDLVKTPLAATRKTQWSYLDKKAVHVGGGLTHRIGLFDGVMLKENHLISSGFSLSNPKWIPSILDKTSESGQETPCFFEIEAETEEEFFTIFSSFSHTDSQHSEKTQALPKVIMFDNFTREGIIDILKTLEDSGRGKSFREKYQIFLEVSGGITPENIKEYDIEGVDVISLGMLTNSIRPIDLSLRIDSESITSST